MAVYVYPISPTHCCIYPISPLMAVYIPSLHSLLYISHLSKFFRHDLVVLLPPGFQLIIIFGNPVRSVLSTWPYQMSCFQVTSSTILSCAPVLFSLILIRFLHFTSTHSNVPSSHPRRPFRMPMLFPLRSNLIPRLWYMAFS
jgi:hypothetical protein